MFGYIKPLQCEMKVRELENFKACYCGLCHALGKNYGLISRFILNYELVFLSMLLWDEDAPAKMGRRRCMASPFVRKRYCISNQTLTICAGCNIILTWWKLRDTISDESFLRALPHRAFSILLRRPYKKAARDLPKFDETVSTKIRELADYEKSGDISLDGAADKFATILSAALGDGISESTRRIFLEFLYHLGRWIYIIDACDDYKDDIKHKRYNPAALRYPPQDGVLSTESIEVLRNTLTHSNHLLNAAYELLPENFWSPIIRNIIYDGMPHICDQILPKS